MNGEWLIDALAMEALADISALREEEEKMEESEDWYPGALYETEKSELRSGGSCSYDVSDVAGTNLSTNAETINGNRDSTLSFDDAMSSGTDTEDPGENTSMTPVAEADPSLGDGSSFGSTVWSAFLDKADAFPGDGSSLRRRRLLPWPRRPSDDEIPRFGSGSVDGDDAVAKDKLDKDILIQGRVVMVKGFWRKSRSFAKRIAEIRVDDSTGVHKLLLYKVGKDGRRHPSAELCISLAGAAVEAIEDLPESPQEQHGFRLFSLPEVGQDPLDLVVESCEERARWLGVLATAVETLPPKNEEVPLAGTCHITVVQATLSSRLRRTVDNGVFIVICYNNKEYRTVTRGLDSVPVDSGEHDVAFGHAKELPVFDDDPDSLIKIELWAANRRGSIGSKDKMLGCIEVPLFLFGRNQLQELCLPLRDAALVGLGCEESYAAGSIHIMGFFQQSFESLFLPRPVSPNKVCYHLVDMPYKAQLKEFESFSSRFVHHCEAWQRMSMPLKHLHQWNRPAVTFTCLLALTLIIEFLHEYIMPVSVLALLCIATVRHPFCQTYLLRLQAYFPNSGFLASICSRDIIPTAKSVTRFSVGQAATPAKTRQEVTSERQICTKDEASVAGLERFENQRRHIFSSFKPQRLRPWLDPAPWTDADGKAAESPQPLQGGVPYTWRVDVNQFTDGEGWRYAKGFGQGAVWTNSFAAGGNVRRRRHIGWPVTSSRPLSSAAELNLPRSDAGDQAIPTAVGVLEVPDPAVNTFFDQSSGLRSRSWGAPNAPKDKESNSKSPLKTPYQEIYRSSVLRAAFMRHQIEYWMDWYERRKNLLLGATSHTSNVVLVLLSGLLLAAMFVPTRWLVLAFIYTFFWDGFVVGRLMRSNRKSFISQLKETAVELWLDSESRSKVQRWGEYTLLDEVTNAGVQTLKLCDWIRKDFFDGRPTPMITLRSVQRCRTLGDLASIVTHASDKFSKRRQRKRVWYKSTMRNLLDHVPSDATIFRSASATYKPPIKT